MIVVTPQVWLALRYPPLMNPLYKRTLNSPGFQTAFFTAQTLGIGAILVTFGFVCLVFTFSASLAFLSTLLLIPLAHTVQGLALTVSVAGNVAALRDNRQNDLFALVPAGQLGSVWAVSNACLQQQLGFREVLATIAALVLMLWGLWVAIALLLLFGVAGEWDSAFAILVSTLTVIALYPTDEAQSTSLALSAAIFGATSGRNGLEARFVALLTFLALQLGVYMVTGILGFFIWDGQVNVLGILLVCCIAFVTVTVLREALIVGLWRLNLHRLNATKVDFHMVIQGV